MILGISFSGLLLFVRTCIWAKKCFVFASCQLPSVDWINLTLKGLIKICRIQLPTSDWLILHNSSAFRNFTHLLTVVKFWASIKRKWIAFITSSRLLPYRIRRAGCYSDPFYFKIGLNSLSRPPGKWWVGIVLVQATGTIIHIIIPPKVINTAKSRSRDVTSEAGHWCRHDLDVTSRCLAATDWSRDYVDHLGCI